MSDSEKSLKWDIGKLAQAMKIGRRDVQEYFTDGRRISFLLERRIAREVLGGELATSESAHFDIVDGQGRRWEVRSISKRGVYFCPSFMVGSGRHFDEPGFLSKLEEISGYVLCDIESFPSVPFWIVSSDQVRTWWESGHLGAGSHLSRKRALALLGERGER